MSVYEKANTTRKIEKKGKKREKTTETQIKKDKRYLGSRPFTTEEPRLMMAAMRVQPALVRSLLSRLFWDADLDRLL